MTTQHISIIIPTRDRIDKLKTCLDRIEPYVSTHPECEVIVSDDGDALESQKVLQGYSRLRIVQGPKRGPAANRNCGVSHSQSDWIVFLDDDCVPDQDLISSYKEAAERHPDIQVLEGRITPLGTNLGFADMCPENENGGSLWSCNFAISRKAFDLVGGFDENFAFPGREDTDFQLRTQKSFQILFCPEARVTHTYDRRTGSRVIRHNHLSVFTFVQKYGIASSYPLSAKFFLVDNLRLIQDLPRRIREGKARDKKQLFRKLYWNLKAVLVFLFWKKRHFVTRLLFPACCEGCRRTLDHLGTDMRESTAAQ